MKNKKITIQSFKHWMAVRSLRLQFDKPFVPWQCHATPCLLTALYHHLSWTGVAICWATWWGNMPGNKKQPGVGKKKVRTGFQSLSPQSYKDLSQDKWGKRGKKGYWRTEVLKQPRSSDVHQPNFLSFWLCWLLSFYCNKFCANRYSIIKYLL